MNAGASAWSTAYAEALPLSQWQILQRLEQQLTYPINLRVNLGDLSQLDPAQLPAEGIDCPVLTQRDRENETHRRSA